MREENIIINMRLSITPPFVLLVSVLVLGTIKASPNNRVNQYSKTINTLEDHLLRDIGFSHKPRIEKVRNLEDCNKRSDQFSADNYL